jgi:S-adenosylmethionine/arginine decarboxylase-like enzyme
MLKNAWGLHMILDLKGCRASSIRCKGHIGYFAKTLVNNINMTAYGPPQIVMFGTGNKKGYTLVQLIETSNITGHFCEETNDAYLDVFSCQSFHGKDVEDVVRSFFDPEIIHSKIIVRGGHKCDKGLRDPVLV